MMRRRRRGFTLIELLAVIAIIGILSGLLLPGLMRGRIEAQKTACMSNLRQFDMGITMYENDGDSRHYYPMWLSQLSIDYFGGSRGIYICPLDINGGSLGARPVDNSKRDEYHDTDDFGWEDSESGGNGSTGRITRAGYNYVPVDPNNSSDTYIKACSYLWEWTREPCSWGGGGYNVDGKSLDTWYENKLYEIELNDIECTHYKYIDGETKFGCASAAECSAPLPMARRSPMIRCFWHMKSITGGDNFNEDEFEVMNLCFDRTVKKGPPKRWHMAF